MYTKINASSPALLSSDLYGINLPLLSLLLLLVSLLFFKRTSACPYCCCWLHFQYPILHPIGWGGREREREIETQTERQEQTDRQWQTKRESHRESHRERYYVTQRERVGGLFSFGIPIWRRIHRSDCVTRPHTPCSLNVSSGINRGQLAFHWRKD